MSLIPSILSIVYKCALSIAYSVFAVLILMMIYHLFLMGIDIVDKTYYPLVVSGHPLGWFCYIISAGVCYFSFPTAGIGVIIGTFGVMEKTWKYNM